VSLLAVGDEPLSEGFVIVSPSTASNEQQVNVIMFLTLHICIVKTFMVKQRLYNKV